MTRVLVLNSATLNTNSYSRLLVDEALAVLRASGKTLEVTTRDLAVTPVPHIDTAAAIAHRTMPGQEGPGYAEATALSDELIAELKAADLILVGCPMYQGGIPSVLKAWFDRILRNGHTVQMTPSGATGLLQGRRVLSILSRGGVHSVEAGGDGVDFQQAYLDRIFGVMGLETDSVLCEGTSFPHLLEPNLKAARARIAEHPWLKG